MRGNRDDFSQDLLPGGNLPPAVQGTHCVGHRGVSSHWGGVKLVTVEADEVAVVQRLGKYVRREEPGFALQFALGA